MAGQSCRPENSAWQTAVVNRSFVAAFLHERNPLGLLNWAKTPWGTLRRRRMPVSSRTRRTARSYRGVARAINYFFCSLVGGTIPFSRMYVTIFP